MIQEFRDFLLKTNALALAVGVIIGAAVGKVVSSLVADILMPVVGVLLPGGTWRDAKVVLTRGPDGAATNSMTYGAFLGSVVDFVIVAFIVFMITKALLRPAAAPPGPPTKTCPECRETIPAEAKRCRACASPV